MTPDLRARAESLVQRVRRIDSCYSNPIGLHDEAYLIKPITSELEAVRREALEETAKISEEKTIDVRLLDCSVFGYDEFVKRLDRLAERIRALANSPQTKSGAEDK